MEQRDQDIQIFIRYSFVLNREKLGIYGKDELEIGVAFNFNYTGFVCIPSSAGFTIKLNN